MKRRHHFVQRTAEGKWAPRSVRSITDRKTRAKRALPPKPQAQRAHKCGSGKTENASTGPAMMESVVNTEAGNECDSPTARSAGNRQTAMENRTSDSQQSSPCLSAAVCSPPPPKSMSMPIGDIHDVNRVVCPSLLDSRAKVCAVKNSNTISNTTTKCSFPPPPTAVHMPVARGAHRVENFGCAIGAGRSSNSRTEIFAVNDADATVNTNADCARPPPLTAADRLTSMTTDACSSPKPPVASTCSTEPTAAAAASRRRPRHNLVVCSGAGARVPFDSAPTCIQPSVLSPCTAPVAMRTLALPLDARRDRVSCQLLHTPSPRRVHPADLAENLDDTLSNAGVPHVSHAGAPHRVSAVVGKSSTIGIDMSLIRPPSPSSPRSRHVVPLPTLLRRAPCKQPNVGAPVREEYVEASRHEVFRSQSNTQEFFRHNTRTSEETAQSLWVSAHDAAQMPRVTRRSRVSKRSRSPCENCGHTQGASLLKAHRRFSSLSSLSSGVKQSQMASLNASFDSICHARRNIHVSARKRSCSRPLESDSSHHASHEHTENPQPPLAHPHCQRDIVRLRCSSPIDVRRHCSSPIAVVGACRTLDKQRRDKRVDRSLLLGFEFDVGRRCRGTEYERKETVLTESDGSCDVYSTRESRHNVTSGSLLDQREIVASPVQILPARLEYTYRSSPLNSTRELAMGSKLRPPLHMKRKSTVIPSATAALFKAVELVTSFQAKKRRKLVNRTGVDGNDIGSFARKSLATSTRDRFADAQ